MKRDTTRDPSNLNRPDWNSLEKNYELHDIGEQHVRVGVQHYGLEPKAWGIDKRHDDDGLIFDDKMDLQVFNGTDRVSEEESELATILEIKTKRTKDWYGTINRRHFRHYLQVAHEYDVPTWIYMTLVDDEVEPARITRDAFVQIEPWDEFQAVLDGVFDYYPPEEAEKFLADHVDDHPQLDATWQAPDGNLVVDLDMERGVTWPVFADTVLSGPETLF